MQLPDSQEHYTDKTILFVQAAMVNRAALYEVTPSVHGTRLVLYIGVSESSKVHWMRSFHRYLHSSRLTIASFRRSLGYSTTLGAGLSTWALCVLRVSR